MFDFNEVHIPAQSEYSFRLEMSDEYRLVSGQVIEMPDRLRREMPSIAFLSPQAKMSDEYSLVRHF